MNSELLSSMKIQNPKLSFGQQVPISDDKVYSFEFLGNLKESNFHNILTILRFHNPGSDQNSSVVHW